MILEKKIRQRVVLQLTECLSDGFNITTDNFFTTTELALELLKNNMTLLGTIRQNRKNIPEELKKSNSREILSTAFR